MLNIAVLCPLDEEFSALMETFELQDEHEEAYERCLVFRRELPDGDGFVSFILPSQQGDSAAAASMARYCSSNNISVAISFGIAGAIDDSACLGDVCVSSTIIDLTTRKKDRPSVEGEVKSTVPVSISLSNNIKLSIRRLKIIPQGKALIDAWSDQRRAWAQSELPVAISAEVNTMLGRIGLRDKPTWHFGSVASYGSVVDCSETKRSISNSNEGILAVETECAGVLQAANNLDIPAIAIRGISDFADGKKKDLDELGNGELRNYAAFNAAHFLKMLISYAPFRVAVSSLQSSAPFGLEASPSNQITDNHEIAHAEIRKMLDLDLPEGLDNNRGALPVPELIEFGTRNELTSRLPMFVENQPSTKRHDLRELLKTRDCVFVAVDPTLFSATTVGLLADHVFSSQCDDKVLVSAVAHCAAYKSYKGFKSLSSELVELEDDDHSIPVYFIYGLSADGGSKIKALLDDITKYPAAKFVLFGNFHDREKRAKPFVEEYSSEFFGISEPSVKHLSMFLETHLGFNEGSSSSDALKIRGVLQRFELPINLNFLVRFSREGILRFLEANNLLDISELFVTTLLLDASACERGKDSYARKTREDFLRQLVLDCFAKTAAPAVEAVRNSTTEYIKKIGFDTNVDKFLEPYLQSHILQIAGGGVVFPFDIVRQYFVAQGIREHSEHLEHYASLAGEEGANLVSLQLAAEMGSDISILRKFLMTEAHDQPDVASRKLAEAEYLANIDPESMANALKEVALQGPKSQETELDLASMDANPADIELQEKMQDVSYGVVEYGRSKIGDDGVKDESGNAQVIDVQRAHKATCMGATLLGGGAENLDIKCKNDLIHATLIFAGAYFGGVTQRVGQIDPDSSIDQLVSEDRERRPDNFENEEFLKRLGIVKSILKVFVHIAPLMGIVSTITVPAKNSVLLRSLIEFEGEITPVETMLLDSWITAIDPMLGSSRLAKQVSRTPELANLKIPVGILLRSFASSGVYDTKQVAALNKEAGKLLPKIKLRRPGVGG